MEWAMRELAGREVDAAMKTVYATAADTFAFVLYIISTHRSLASVADILTAVS